MAYCKACWNAYQSDYRKRRYAQDQQYRQRALEAARMTRYGISKEQYDEMFDRQVGVCAICSRSDSTSLSVDHDHSTGRIRALLCRTCNSGLGMFGDDRDLFRRAITYLESFDS